jgi:CheY-like chemotaxis protein
MDHKPILYVEDNKDDVYFMERAFKEAALNRELIVVSNGQDARDYLTGAGKFSDRNRHPLPCLVLMDLSMPGTSGLELLEWIRTQPAVSTILVIVFTSSNQETDIHRAYAQGANAYLLKPARPEKLGNMLKALKDFWLDLNQPPPEPNRFNVVGRA